VRTARTVFGGRASAAARPLVTQSIIALCVAVFALQWFGGERVTDDLSFFAPEALAQPYRFLTSAFLHSPTFILHIVMNMYALWILGPYLESLLGRVRFTLLYLLSALGGSVGYFVIAPPSGQPGAAWVTSAVGASGAIFGLFSALVIVNRRLGRDVTGVIGVILINAVLGFAVSGIAWQAHLGGLITGAAVAALMAAPAPALRRGAVQAVGLAAVAVVLVALVMVKAAMVPSDLLIPA
jgi:membrane associated rhomboid family serine protease